MAGKPRIPAAIHARIRKLHASGEGPSAIAKKLRCSNYTVRKALDSQFVVRERARLRVIDAVRTPERAKDPRHRAYQAAYADRDEYREASRLRMAALRVRRARQKKSRTRTEHA